MGDGPTHRLILRRSLPEIFKPLQYAQKNIHIQITEQLGGSSDLTPPCTLASAIDQLNQMKTSTYVAICDTQKSSSDCWFSCSDLFQVTYKQLKCVAKKMHDALLQMDNQGIETLMKKYEQECQIMASLRHPNITQFLGICYLPDTKLPLLVMEQLDMSLDDLLEYVPNLPVTLFLEGISREVHYLHKRERNLPIVLINLLTSSLSAKISDMGNSRIASLKPGQLAPTLSKVPGTLVYMPPEAVSDDHRYRPSLDIFSLGHLALYTVTQIFPGDLLSGRVKGREIEHRAIYIKKLEAGASCYTQSLVDLVKQCLDDAPEELPSYEDFLQRIHDIKVDLERSCGGSSLKIVDIGRVKLAKDMKTIQEKIKLEMKTQLDEIIRGIEHFLQQETEKLHEQLKKQEDELQKLRENIQQQREEMQQQRDEIRQKMKELQQWLIGQGKKVKEEMQHLRDKLQNQTKILAEIHLRKKEEDYMIKYLQVDESLYRYSRRKTIRYERNTKANLLHIVLDNTLKNSDCISLTDEWFRNELILSQRKQDSPFECLFRSPILQYFAETECIENIFPFSAILGLDDVPLEAIVKTDSQIPQKPCREENSLDGSGDLTKFSISPASAYVIVVQSKHDKRVRTSAIVDKALENVQSIIDPTRSDERPKEEMSYTNAKYHSVMTGFKESIVDKYRAAFKFEECKDGFRCMRHADIPGLFSTWKSSQSPCSRLIVSDRGGNGATKSERRSESITQSGTAREYHPRTSSLMNRAAKSDTRCSQLTTEYAPQLQAKGGSQESVAVNRGKALISTTKFNYGCDKKRIDSITPLLHAQAFTKIVSMVDPLLVSEPHDQSFIPFFFISGLSHYKLVNYSDASARFVRCNELCREFEKPGDSALCNLYLGDIKFSSHHYLEACNHYQLAASKYSSDTVAAQFRMVPPSLSAIHAKHGSALRHASKMVDAIHQYKLAIKEAKTDKDRLAANTSLGNLYQSLGENTSALSHYEQSVELSETLHDYISLGWAHGNMGNAYLGLFQKDKALYHLLKSLELTLAHEPTPQAIGRTYNNLGTAYQSLGELDKAQEQYEYALSQAVYGNDRAGQARVYGNMGNVLMLRKKYEEAVPQYTEVLQLSKDRSTLSTAHHNRGCAYYEWGETKMEEKYGKAVELEVASGGRKLRDGETKAAVVEAQFYIRGQNFRNFSEFRPHKLTHDIAMFYRKGCEDLSEVVKYHEGHLDNIKGSSKGLTLSVSLFETNSRTFHRLQDCLVNLGEEVKALLVAEQSRARTLGELMLKRKGWCLQNPVSSPMPFDQIIASVGCIEHPLLYLSYTGARLLGWVFVSVEENVSMNMFEVPLKDDQFDGKSFDYHLRYSLTEALVERSFEMYREVGNYDEDTSAPVQTLYNLIAKPLLQILEKCNAQDVHKLIVITDSYTALLPFSSLHDPNSDSFLGDTFSFQLMPSFLTMSILNQLPDTNIVHLPTDAHNMCIVGNPNIPQFKYNNELWNLGKLPHAKREAEAVAHIMKTTPILESQATKSAVLMRIMNSKIIHLATHGSASSGFLAFGMLVPLGQDTAANAQGVLLYPEEVEKLNINPALVVLSSCDSGRGAVKADGIQGMARAFILAGAQAVLTTLWRVPDESAAVFMQFFYQFMMDGFESTKALQKAILSIRCFSKYSQYIHWSGYQLTGREVYLKYTIPEETHILEKCLGKSNVFPRLQDVKLLESDLVDATCYPTDVQILEASPGLDAQEIVIDFIHNSYKHFTGGIFWISCEQAEFITESIKYIEKIIGGSLEKLQLSELQQCLVIFDGISELPSSESLVQLMASRYTHCIMLYQHYLPPDDLMRSIDHKLLRGSKVHHVEPLSTILSTQRIVYAIQKESHFCPKSSDQTIIEKISNRTSGSPILVNIVSRLISSYFTSASQELLKDILTSFEVSIVNITAESDSSSSTSSSSSRELSSSVSDSLPSISILAPECRDEWDTPGSYDSWDFIAGLLSACNFNPETKLLLDCLSHLGCGPIPLSIVSTLSTLITKTSGRTHLAGSLITQLMDTGFVKVYPSPVVIHPNLKQHVNEFVYVPKYVGDYILKELECPDKAVALATCFHALSHKALAYSSVIIGLLKSLLILFELNSNLVGETCYGELYRLYLSHL